MRKTIITIALLALTATALFSCGEPTTKKGGENLLRAQEMFDKVWKLYRVEKYGLFSEYYPSSHRPDLTYFSDEVKQAQEVSYLWPMSGVFSSAVALASVDRERYLPYLDSMVMAVEQYYDTIRQPYGYQAYPSQFQKVDRYYDDNGLVGIDYIDTYAVTKNPAHLEKAKQVMTFILSGWGEDYEGGVSWLEGIRDQKPACSNGKALVLALKLYEATGDSYYLQAGQRFYRWMDKYLRDRERNVVWNAWLTPDGGKIHPDLYTYNTGTLLQAACMLYRFTNQSSYLDDAKALAEGSYNVFFRFDDNGVPYIADLPWFNLVLFRGYHALYNIDGERKYVDTMIRSLDYAWDNARDNAGLFFHDWRGIADEKSKPKWLLDTSCIPEFYVRAAQIKGEI